MKKLNKFTMIITSIVILLPMFAGIFLWNRLPDTMATHFGLDNEPNGFMGKTATVFIIPLVLLAIQWICALVTSRDEKASKLSDHIFTLVLWIVPVISIVLMAIIYPYNLGYRMNVTFIAEIFMGLLFIIVGNYMPKMRQNFFVGIRIPWTLSNEENWNRTHRMAGFLWVVGGLIILVMAFVGVENAWLFLGVLLIVTIVPCVYSGILSLKLKKNS